MKAQICAMFLGVTLVASLASPVSENTTPIFKVSKMSDDFNTDLYNHIEGDKMENILTCPLGVTMMMTMAALGARENTATQMRTAMKMLDDDAVIQDGFKELMNEINKDRPTKMYMANKLFMMKDMNMKKDFMDMTENTFMSKPEMIDFNNNAEAAKKINDWAEEKTQNHVKEMVTPEDMKDAKLMLVNAVYFKANWETKFPAADTTNKPWHMDSKTTKDVPMMKQTAMWRYGSIDEAGAMYIELPFVSEKSNENITMAIIMPKEIDGFKDMEAKLDDLDWAKIHETTPINLVTLTMPKLTMESTMNLEPMLKKMGMTDMFDTNSNFGGMTDSKPMIISKVMQKTFLKMDEEGAEAAGVSGMLAAGRSLPLAAEMTVDRPFCFAIVMETPACTMVLFEGHVIDPQEQ